MGNVWGSVLFPGAFLTLRLLFYLLASSYLTAILGSLVVFQPGIPENRLALQDQWEHW
jgi:hypothetical protein